jgi:hypothetical protein
MVRMFVRHQVEDYGSWRKGYDTFGAKRGGFGVVGHTVCCAADNPNDVTVTHDFDSLDKAKAFVESADLKEAMAAAGVKGQPTIWFTNVV